jgi:hypothetical protein
VIVRLSPLMFPPKVGAITDEINAAADSKQIRDEG